MRILSTFILIIFLVTVWTPLWLIHQSRERTACYRHPSTISINDCPQPGKIELFLRDVLTAK